MIFTKTRPVKSPSRGTQDSAGLDLYIPDDHPEFHLFPNESINIPSGIRMILETDYCGLILNKSGVGVKGVLVGAQVIDSDYRGEVHLNVHNVSKSIVTFKPGQKLVQMLIIPVLIPAAIAETSKESFELYGNTSRGSGGFGSTGQF